MVPNMVCSFCRRTVLGSNKSWDHHHDDPIAFRDSVSQGCVFCHRLAQDIQQQGIPFELLFLNKAVYCWTLRPAVKIRESREFVVLAFRSIKVLEDVELPGRTFYLFPDEDLGHIPAANQLGNRTDSSRCWSQVSEWVNICTSKHDACIRKHSWRDFIPTRLIDIGLSGPTWPPTSVRVVDTAAEAVHAPYVTLSHCWGQDIFVELLDDNFHEYSTRGVPWSQIETNQNFADALLVARNLGIRYIWIDSLCIIQRQPDRRDFDREAQKMHLVYRNSYCNIASADSPNKDGGLFRDRGDAIPRIIPAEFTPGPGAAIFRNKGKWRIFPADMYQGELLSKVLYTRAWVFQERLLSPRLLHFSHSQIFWDCAAFTACESLPEGLPLPLDMSACADRNWRERLQDAALMVPPLSGTANHSLEEFWARAVRYYTGCHLGFAGDKLQAIWGVAKLVRDALAEDYGAGLWSKNLAEQLAWRVVDPASSARPSDQKNFPSWSWASVRGVVEVGERIPAWPSSYSVTSHDGGDLEFKLNRYLHRQSYKRDQSDWKHELALMGGDIQRMNSRGEGIVAKAASTRPGQSTADYVGLQGAKFISVHEMPELEESRLAIRGHIIAGILERTTTEKAGWRLTTEGFRQLGGETMSLQAFPDTIPASQEVLCAFVILTASHQLNEEWLEADDQEPEAKTAKYSGVGIILEGDGHEFTRIGSLRFDSLCQDAWASLSAKCCGGRCGMEEEGLAGGVRFWLK